MVYLVVCCATYIYPFSTDIIRTSEVIGQPTMTKGSGRSPLILKIKDVYIECQIYVLIAIALAGGLTGSYFGAKKFDFKRG